MSQAFREIEFGSCTSADSECGGKASRPASETLGQLRAATRSPSWLTADLGSFKPVYRESLSCDECGADTDTEELFEGVCMSCSVEDGCHSTLYARGGSVA